jgi:His/Glu/Gln/Arg/opine family amino acid ABC transporter permease subunit
MSAANWLSLVQGGGVTAVVSLAGIAIGLPFGLLLAVLRWTRIPVLAQLAALYVSVVRAAPAVTLGLLIFFALPTIGIEINPIPAGIATLAISTSAFDCEIFRGGLAAFPRDQLEAAMSFGMPAMLRFRRIVLPQVFRNVRPALINEMTLIVKASPAIAVMGVVDITRAAVEIGAATYRPLPPFLAALVLYSLFVLVFVVLQRTAERRARAEAAA